MEAKEEKLILAPMVRIGTTPFRLLALRNGADIVFTEEIIAKKLMCCEKAYNEDLDTNDYISKKDGSLVLRTHKEEKGKLVLQIGASNPEDALKAALVVKDDIVGVDVNMGCPKHFSTHGNMGSALLLQPQLAKEFSGLPVSCKIRLLEDKDKTREFIEAIQSTGIDYFTIHLRIKDQTAEYKANWKALQDIKTWAKIPFNVNGDILSPLDIYKLKKCNIANGFMLARGAIHNPRIFQEFKTFSLEEYENNNWEDIDSNNFLNNDYEEVESKVLNNKINTNDSLYSSDNVKASNKLSKVFDKKYPQAIFIVPIIKEFVEICLRVGNAFGNSKYVALYILKTHKKHLALFKQIQDCRNYEELCDILEMKEVYTNMVESNANMKYYYEPSTRPKQLNVNKNQIEKEHLNDKI